MTSSVTLGAPCVVVLPGPLAPAGFDHHDGHVAVREGSPGDDELEGRLFAFGVSRVRHPCAVLRISDAHGPDRALEGYP